jgi:hypothetical protein
MADWSASQQHVAILLASGSKIRDAATVTSTGERTIHNWLADPAYRAVVVGFRDQLLSETIGRLTQAATRATTTLEALLDAENESVRLRAALGVIDAMVRTREHGELAARVEELERRLTASMESNHR